MIPEGDLIHRRLALFARAASVISVAIPLLVLIGWEFGIGWLTTILPHLVTMKPVTAVCFLACGISLRLHIYADTDGAFARIAARCLPVVAVGCGIGTFVGQVTQRDYFFEDTLFRRALLESGIVHPGRMSPASALGFVVLGLGLMLFGKEPARRLRLWQPMAFAVIIFATIQFVGYLYGAGDLYKTFGQNPMALHTAFLFLMLGHGMFAARCGHGWMGVFTSPRASGVIARRILPGAILFPLAIGWLRLEGQRIGLYQTEFGLALFASLNIATFAMVLWFAARSLSASEARLEGANENLALSEERLRMATTGGGIGTWNWDLLTGRMHNSPLCRQICGLPPTGEVSIVETVARIHPDDHAMVEKAMNRASRSGGELNVECRMIWPDGSVHWVASNGKAFSDASGRAIRVEGIVQEITERKFAEEQTKLLAAIAESSEDAIFTKDLRGVVTSWNPGAERIYGYKPEEIVGQPIGMLAVPGKEKELEELMERLRQGETIRQFEAQRRAKSGKILDVSLTVSPLRDSSGMPMGMSVVARDITGQRAVERQLRQSQKMEAVGQLAGGVAHDFNNLLMVMMSYAQIIRDAPPANPQQQKNALQILEAGERAAAVTRQLLAFSRKQMQDLKIIDLNEVILQFCKMLPHFLGEQIQLEFSLGAKAAWIRADRGQIEQVLMNLVVNGRDAMPQGGRLLVNLEVIEVGADYCLARGLTLTAGSYSVISVKDSGVGMNAETQAHIFEPFFTTKEVGKGTGLGLSTVYGIVKQHKGIVWVFSEIGMGTEFKVYLPSYHGEQEQEARLCTPAESEGGSETILVVEDEKSLREVLVEYLTGKGYRVLAAEDGAAAKTICETCERPVEVLLTDFIMPGRRGPEVAEDVLKIHPGARVIMMSGYADRDMQSEEGQMKYTFLQKPLNLRTLAEQIRVSLAREVERA